MLRWSASETGRTVDISGVAHPHIDPGVPGGRALTALGRGAVGITISTELIEAVADELGPQAAIDAAAVAGAFEHLNRIVDGSGLPVGKAARRLQADIIETLKLDAFPHAAY